MTSARRQDRIEEIFSSIYELSGPDRAAVLRAVEDSGLRAEVQALLETHDTLSTGSDGFLEALDADLAATLLERSGTGPKSPRHIGRYEIVRPIARGGMGIVYLGRDARLDRPVAIKLLPPHLRADPASMRRLADEARTASALDDSRIATVYEIGETDEGTVFVAMAYYDGETLRERIRRGLLAAGEVVELGLQLAEGLGAAHRAGIVHRDIKPENILVTREGGLKIVDFGLAKMLGEGQASAGLLPGTAAYMSPEQTRGEDLDHRTDIWSAGVVLYEMLAGERPFRGAGDALVHTIRHDRPVDLATLRPDAPDGLITVIEGCLEKEVDRRLHSAAALAEALRKTQVDTTNPRVPSGVEKRSRKGLTAALGAGTLAALLVGALLTRGDGSVPASLDSVPPAIAVLPFETHGEELDLWREGMVDVLSIGLDGATELRVIDPRTVLARWREAVGGTAVPDLELALQIARRTGAEYAVVGSVVPSASGLRFGARVHSLSDGRDVATLHVEGAADSLLTLVDRLAIDILAATWQGEKRRRRPVDLTRITTASLPALKSYLEGESLLRRADFAAAAAAYERAVAADSAFAFALFHLGFAYGWLGEERRQDESYASAVRHAGRLPEREVLFLRAVTDAIKNPVLTIELLSEVARRYPDDPEAWYFLGDRYWHDGEQALVSQQASELAFRRAVELDPGFAPAYIHLVHNAFIHLPDSVRAVGLIETYGDIAPNSDTDVQNRVAFGLAFGDSVRRMEAFAALDTLPPGTRLGLADRYLDHPRFRAAEEAVLVQRPLSGELVGQLMTARLFEAALSRGGIRSALSHLEDARMPTGLRQAGFYRMYQAGLSLPGVGVAAALQQPPDVSVPALQSVLVWFYLGAYAADLERWEEHSSAVESLSLEAARLDALGDTATARSVRGAVSALRGKGLWASGDPVRALPLLVEGQRQATWPVSTTRRALNESIRWWLGNLLLEAGRPRDAAVYFESFWNDALAAERLGPIYERLGDAERAREAYEFVVTAWKDADPELRPRVEAAQAGLERLAVDTAD